MNTKRCLGFLVKGLNFLEEDMKIKLGIGNVKTERSMKNLFMEVSL